MAENQEIVATGRRKTSVARVRMTAGSGKIDINGRSFEEYFPTAPLQNAVLQPLQTV
ncbi:MAG: 30S ribosomal protein S9, partial [Verrucomicrobia bacterium]